MKELIVGIDFAINSTGICFQLPNEQYKFIGLIREDYSLPKKAKEFINLFNKLTENIQIILLNKHDTSKVYHERELLNIQDASYLTDCIINCIQNEAKNIDIENIFISIEGLSFGSASNRLAEISGFQYLLREKIYKLGYNLYVFSPKTIKMIAGKGNFNKLNMQEAFFKENINKKQLDIFKNTTTKIIMYHPWEDMADALFVTKTLKEKILNKQ